jgi:hypothetical protein
MTTALDDLVVVEPSGLIKACAWCVSRARLEELGRTYAVSHALCTSCAMRLEQEGV